MKGLTAAAFTAAIVLGACRSTPREPPQAAAAAIAAALQEGNGAAAALRFQGIQESERHREAAYAVLYERAKKAYEAGRYAEAETFLRFLVERYPRASAPKEALLYTLFLLRVEAGRPAAPARLAEMEELAAALEARPGGAPPWVALVRTQTAVDRGRYEEARSAFARFRGAWDGEPAELAAYVTELDRFLATHGGGAPR